MFQHQGDAMDPSALRTWQTCALLALANLFWAGKWVVGRALREVYPPLTLNFWRWLLAALILAPIAWPLLRGKWHLVRRHAVLLCLLALTGGAMFQSMVYLGLRHTTTTNAVLIGSSAPMFVMLCSWLIERQKAGYLQMAGMLLSFAGVLVILSHGELALLLHLDIHAGDAWILLGMPVWGIYSVLVKRLPAQLRGSAFLFAMAALTVPMLAGPMAVEASRTAPLVPRLTMGAIGGLAYTATFASVLAFMCWNRAVAAVGPNAAGTSLPLMPLFGTVLAMIFLGEQLQAFHLAGIVTILAGIAVAARAPNASGKVSRRPAAAPATCAAPEGPPAQTTPAA
jgi:drug/metabolite transporter (DMT)-like permease